MCAMDNIKIRKNLAKEIRLKINNKKKCKL